MDPIPAIKNPKCTQCNMTFSRMSFFDLHMRNVHGETEYMRINRLSDSVKEVLFPEPVKIKLVQKSLDCSECGILFWTIEEQKTHIKQIHGNNIEHGEKKLEARFVCDLCDKPFERKGPMVNHRLLVHTVRTKDIHCDFCDIIFANKTNLCSHISSKHSEYFAPQENSLNKDIKTEYCNEDEKEEGEVQEDKFIIEEDLGSYKFESWGGSGKEKEGYSFKGKKKEFAQAILEVQRLFFTNKEYEINKVKFSLEKKTKDDKGTGQNYLMKVQTKNEEGNATLKTWDKNFKSEYKMVVTKTKGYDVKFVKELAETIQTLLDKNISGEGWSMMKSVNKVKCETCGKFYSSERYLKKPHH